MARLIGKPLYLRGCWMQDHLKFDENGLPSGKVTSGPFAEAAIDVKKVKLSNGVLRVEGQRVGLEFSYRGLKDTNVVAKRVAVKGPGYDGSISIEIQGPSDGDFTKALDAIFAQIWPAWFRTCRAIGRITRKKTLPIQERTMIPAMGWPPKARVLKRQIALLMLPATSPDRLCSIRPRPNSLALLRC